MQLYLQITASLLLSAYAFHLASLEESTDSPGYTIDKAWLRELVKNAAESQNITVTEEDALYYRGSDAGAIESSSDYSGTPSGSMSINNEEDENGIRHETGNNGSDAVTTTLPSTVSGIATKLPELSNTTVTITTTGTTEQSPVNMTETEEDTIPKSTTSSSEANATQKSTTKEDTGLHFNTTTVTTTTTTTPVINETFNTLSATTTLSPAAVNRTALGNDAERGLASDANSSKSNGAWAAVLGTGVAVACVGLVAYIILRKKQQRNFSHRKLVEETGHPNPVLRLDNSEPLDLNFGGGAYYNPGLQGDNIQMSNFPGPHRK